MDENMITTRTSLGLEKIIGKGMLFDKLTIVEGVLHLIYRKTLLLLVPEDNNRHWIVPHNLRELCNFIYFLQSMEDIAFKENKDKKSEYELCRDDDFDPKTTSREEANRRLETLESNLRRLMQYIVSDLLDYSTSNMSDDTRGMAEVLVKLIRDLPDWTLITMNKKIVRDILMYAGQDKSVYKEFYSDQQRDALLKAARHNYIVSMGDVQYVLGVLSSRSNDYTIKKLTEYVRVIWSIKMTMEFYCVGVKSNHNERKKELYEKNAGNPEEGYNYITTHFRDTVGGMMFNPDISTQFFKIESKADGITVNKNWIVLNIKKDDKCENPDFKIIGKESCYPLGCMTVFCTKEQSYKQNDDKKWINTAIEGECTWRTLSSGQYYRENQSLSGVKTIHLNYFSLFTNLLSPKSIGFDDVEKNDYYNWQNNHIMVFPFYSMDWMNRFYNELKKNCRDSKTDNIVKAIDNLNAGITNTLTKMEDITQAYVKHMSGQKLIGNDFLTRFKAIESTISLNIKDCFKVIQNSPDSIYDSICKLKSILTKLIDESQTWSFNGNSTVSTTIHQKFSEEFSQSSNYPEKIIMEIYDKIQLSEEYQSEYEEAKKNEFIESCKKMLNAIIDELNRFISDSIKIFENISFASVNISDKSIYELIKNKIDENLINEENNSVKWIIMAVLQEIAAQYQDFNKKGSTIVQEYRDNVLNNMKEISNAI